MKYNSSKNKQQQQHNAQKPALSCKKQPQWWSLLVKCLVRFTVIEGFLGSVCENAWLTQLQTKQKAAWPHFYEPACPENGWKCSVFDVTSTSRRHHSCFPLPLIQSRWRCRADDLQLTPLPRCSEVVGSIPCQGLFLCRVCTCYVLLASLLSGFLHRHIVQATVPLRVNAQIEKWTGLNVDSKLEKPFI